MPEQSTLPNSTPALPAGTRLVHIGPHKTGTTAIQGALHKARKELARHGTVVAHRTRQPMREVQAMTGGPAMKGVGRQDPRMWEKLVAAVESADAERVVVSSEFFADGDEYAARRAVADLGGPQVHVVVTLRPLAKILPSQWQQYVQNGLTADYETWLDVMFNKPPSRHPNPTFWTRHRHDRLVERWADAAGADNVTVIVPDESDRSMLLRVFEGLLALPEGLLREQPDQANRSLSWEEVELVRRCNEEFEAAKKWPREVYHTHFRLGAVKHMKTARRPAPDEPAIVTPEWALGRAAELGAKMAGNIKGTGVRVIGDLDRLREHPEPAERPEEPDPALTEAAAEAILGAIDASVHERRLPPAKPAPTVDEVPTKDLAKIILHRMDRRIGSRLKSLKPGRS